jgi:glycosyltransferase involved in cell wall biosynthesis
MGLLDRPRLALSLLRGEGAGAVWRRMLDRAEERARRRSFDEVGEDRLGVRASVLNVLGTPPAPRLGGVQTALVRRLEQEAAHRPLALLYPFRQCYRLEATGSGRRTAARVPGPTAPQVPVLRDPAFETAARHAAKIVGASTVHVENLAGLAPGSVADLARGGLRLVLGVQDFAPYCPRPHLLEHPGLAFCEYCAQPDRCRRCLARSWPLDPEFLESYRSLCAEALQSATAVVWPSSFLRDRTMALVPGLDRQRQHVIEPASGATPPAPRERGNGPLHAAFVGAVRPHKGALVFEQVVGAATGGSSPALRWSAYGGGDARILRRLRRMGVAVHGYYRAGSLPSLLRRDSVDVALVLSTWPEAYGLVVDECLVAGVRVVAFDTGAPAERLRGSGGVLVPAAAGAQGVLQALATTLPPRDGPVPDLPRPARAAEATLRLYARLED